VGYTRNQGYFRNFQWNLRVFRYFYWPVVFR
jgi:hypothetical protein